MEKIFEFNKRKKEEEQREEELRRKELEAALEADKARVLAEELQAQVNNQIKLMSEKDAETSLDKTNVEDNILGDVDLVLPIISTESNTTTKIEPSVLVEIKIETEPTTPKIEESNNIEIIVIFFFI